MTLRRIHQLVDRNLSQRPDAPALKDSDGRIHRWCDLASLTHEAAELLLHNGAGPGARVLVVGENGLALPVLIHAASRIGAWAVPVNARMSAAEIARISDHAQPALTVYTSQTSANAAQHAGDAARYETGFGTVQMRPGESPVAPCPGLADPTAILLYTTGTTGDPKGVMLSHDNLLFAARLSANLRGLNDADHVYGALPLTHVFGVASMLMAAAHAGAMVELSPRFDPARLMCALQAGVSVFPAVPQMHALLMAHAESQGCARPDAPRLRYVSSGAAPLDPAWKRKAEAFYGLPLQNGYGMTESTAGISATSNAIGDPDTSVGLPLPGVEVKLAPVAKDGTGIGEVLTRGRHVMQGYFRNPDATAQTVQDGWLHTGDLGHIDARGRLHIVARAKELIIHGGFNVFPPEVEAALNDHPAVLQSAVIGQAENGDEQVLAFVQLRAGHSVSAADLAAFAADRLAGYKRPGEILIVDALPAAATGKVLKHQLLPTFRDRLDHMRKAQT